MKSFNTILFIILFTLFSVNAYASVNFQNENSIEEYVLENGLSLYVLEDYSSPVVRIEFCAAAGFSKQEPDNAGFFPLYTELFKYASPAKSEVLSELYCECNADAARYIIKVTSQEVRETMKALSQCAFDPFFSDYDINIQLEKAKKSVTENAFSVEGFINSSIDSRVFAKGPWKHDSGIYPAIFSKTNTSECRVILYDIARRYYYPKNCALFISGAVNKNQILQIAEETFGKNILSKNAEEKINNFDFLDIETEQSDKKLFVLTDPEFSPEMTQIVVQYKDLKMEECDFAAVILENEISDLKKELLSQKSFGIRAPQYINAVSTHKNNSSRLIIQSLFENPKTSPCKNALDFVKTLNCSVQNIDDEQFNKAQDILTNSFDMMLTDSHTIMDLLSQFWAVKDFSREQNFDTGRLVEDFYNRPFRLSMTECKNVKSKLNQEDPFVFVLVNSTVYKKYKNEFSQSGFETITVKNGSWYTQKLYSTIKNSLEHKSESDEQIVEKEIDDLFVEKNNSTICQLSLKNNIPVYVKHKPFTSTVSFCLVIDGGEVNDGKNNYGLESVIVDTVALKTKSFLYQKYQEGKIKSLPSVESQTDFFSSAIYVECLSSELPQIIEAFSEALIYSDFTPAMVDSVVMQRKSDQIVKTSSPVFQLYSNAVNSIFKNKEYQNIYSLNQDILKKIEFTQILEGSTKLFNADKYKIIICGNVEGEENSFIKIKEQLDQTFGVLVSEGKIKKPQTELNELNRKTKKVKLVHQFFTDVSKEKAGPRPQVLIPTTEFLDPAQFWIKNEFSKKQNVIFNALLFDFSEELQKSLNSVQQKTPMVVISQGTQVNMDFANITILNVKSSSIVDAIYSQVFSDYKSRLDENSIKRIKNGWVKKSLGSINTNNGLCLLIKEGLDAEQNIPDLYLKDYDLLMNASVEDFAQVFESFDFEKLFRLYSADTKKQ